MHFKDIKAVINICNFFIIVLLFFVPNVLSENVYEAILNRDKHQNLTEFANWIRGDELLRALLMHRKVTVFAPSNEAINEYIRRYRDNNFNGFADNHVIQIVADEGLFPLTIGTQNSRAPNLYLNYKTVQPKGPERHSRREYYVNNALIQNRFDYNSQTGERQILYIIDEVLKPMIPDERRARAVPLANDLIQQPEIYGLREGSWPFYSRITDLNEGNWFSQAGNHTFFIPDSADFYYEEQYNRYIVRGHVIPNRVLFLRVMSEDSYRPAAYDDEHLRVELSLTNRTGMNDREPIKVQSITTRDNFNNNLGKVLSSVKTGNIPVANGVVHFISNPLMYTQKSIYEYIEGDKQRFSAFQQLLSEFPDIIQLLRSTSQRKTVLVPKDSAFRRVDDPSRNYYFLNELRNNRTKLEELLNLHVIEDAISTIEVRNGHKGPRIPSRARGILLFEVLNYGKRAKFNITTECNTSGITTQSDIAATNGIIHVIDRVLGEKTPNLFERLQSNHNFSKSLEFASKLNPNWNEQFTRNNSRFTYFAPDNNAWQNFRRNYPEDYENFERGQNLEQLRRILNSHLIINSEYSFENLRALGPTHTAASLVTIRANGSLVSGNITANVTNPNIHGQNGVIHGIDNIILPRDFSMMILANANLLMILLLMTFIF